MKIKPAKAIEGRTYPCATLGMVPSVTTVLKVLEKRHLETWRARVGRKEADRVSGQAKVLGTRVHTMAERLAWDRNRVVEGDLAPFADAVRGFLNAHVRKPLKTELSLVSAAERVGGTLDLYCETQDGKLAVVDFKTSTQLTREHGLQTALYALLLREHGYEVHKRIVVRIKKDKPGEWHARAYGDHAGDVRAARACVELWHWQKGRQLLKAMEADKPPEGEIMDKQSPKQELQEWLSNEIAREIEANGSCNVPATVSKAADHFSQKPAFMKDLVVEILRPVAYQSARQIIKTTRMEEAVELGGEVVARSEFEQRAQSRFERWIENVGRGRDVRVMDMSKEDCLTASLNRRQRARHEDNLADLFEALERNLKGGQSVKDVFTPEEVETLYERIKSNRGEAA